MQHSRSAKRASHLRTEGEASNAIIQAPASTDEILLLMARRCFALDLDGDQLIAEYERMHEPGAVWPAVVQHIRASGVEAMEIWRTGDRLFMIAEVADDYPRPIETPAEVKRWEELMWRFQQPLPNAAEDEKWIPMKRIFNLEEQ